jgi:toxin ParE1/3/4
VAVGDYLIIYRPIEGGIEIVRVLHGRRDINALFSGRS